MEMPKNGNGSQTGGAHADHASTPTRMPPAKPVETPQKTPSVAPPATPQAKPNVTAPTAK